MTTTAKDLTKEAPRSPHDLLGGYAILARTTDKCRALLADSLGDYHFDCPLDNMLFSFKEVTGDDFKAQIEADATDAEIVAWMDSHGAAKTADEVKAWTEGIIAAQPYNDPERREWFAEQCAPLKLDPANTTLFQWLDADDQASYAK